MRAIDERGAYAAQALDAALRRSALARADRSLAAELTYGATRRLSALDWAIGRAASRPVAAMDGWTRNILRLGAYQLLYLDRIPAAAAVHEAVELAKRFGHPGTAAFVNAVLREIDRRRAELAEPMVAGDPVGTFALRHAHPTWVAARWLERFGCDEAARLCEANNRTPALVLRVNRLLATRAELIERLGAEGFEARPGLYHGQAVVVEGHPAVEGLRVFREGLCTVQDEASMLAASALGARPGDTVIDACAGLGGKSTHLGELMENRGRVIACDLHEHKLRLLRAAARRLGVGIVAPLHLDARRLPELMPGRADAVIVDAPCSGLGVLRRRPDLRWRKGPAQLQELPRLQLELLTAAAACVKPGGALLYCTCSTEPEENGAVVERFLARASDFEAESLWRHLPVELWNEAGVDRGWLQLLPHRHGVDGFFIARLRRRGG